MKADPVVGGGSSTKNPNPTPVRSSSSLVDLLFSAK